MTKRRLECPLALLLAAAGAVALAACGTPGANTIEKPGIQQTSPGKDKPVVTLGYERSTDERVLGHLYGQALQAKGYRVRLRPTVGSPAALDKALASRQIDLYPGYTGVIDRQLAKVAAPPTSPQQAYQAAAQLEKKRGFTMMHPTLFQDVGRVATTNTFANAHGLLTTEDLGKLPSFTFGAPPEARTSFDGLVGMQQVYRLTNVVFKALPAGQQYQALDRGQVDTIEAFTIDGQLARGGYLLLSDPKAIFGFDNEAPVVSDPVLTEEGPQFVDTLNTVSAQLTDQAMQTMDAAVDLDHQDPAAAAGKFLTDKGLK